METQARSFGRTSSTRLSETEPKNLVGSILIITCTSAVSRQGHEAACHLRVAAG